ncbi:hypothetical protein KFE94_16160 [bacterium SCSIO 12643]|nr:hypothetical protein KFE94_16160 [bacterium SCSIO 12643]
MKKFALVFMVCMSNMLSAYTQPQKIQLSKDYNIEKQKPPMVISEDEKGLVAYHTFLKDEKIILELGYLNNEFEWGESVKVNLESNFDSPSIENVIFKDGEFLIFVSEWLIKNPDEVVSAKDLNGSNIAVSVFKVNLKTGKNSKITEVLAYEFKFESGLYAMFPEIVISDNKDFFCISYQEVKYRESAKIIGVTVNYDMEIVNHFTHFEEQRAVMEMEIYDVDISNAGAVSFLVRSRFSPVRRMRDEDYISVVYFDVESEKGKRFDVKFEDKSLFVSEKGCLKNFDDNGNIILAGTYSQGTKYHPLGTFYVLVNVEENTIEFKHLGSFSQQIVLRWFDDNEKAKQKAIKSLAKNKGVPLRKLEAEKCILNKDGSLTLVLTQEYSVNYGGLDKINGNLILVKMSADGSEVHWEYLLKKTQSFNVNDDFSEAVKPSVEINDDGDCFVIYNEGDYFDEINLDEPEENGEHSIPNLVLVKISALGKEEFNDVILKSEEEGVIFDPASLRMVGNEKIYFWGKYSSNGVFAIIDI